MLLYLNEQTWAGPKGEALAAEAHSDTRARRMHAPGMRSDAAPDPFGFFAAQVRAARARQLPQVLLHV